MPSVFLRYSPGRFLEKANTTVVKLTKHGDSVHDVKYTVIRHCCGKTHTNISHRTLTVWTYRKRAECVSCAAKASAAKRYGAKKAKTAQVTPPPCRDAVSDYGVSLPLWDPPAYALNLPADRMPR